MARKIFHNTSISNYTFLVTGGAGFIGSNLVDYLVENKAGKVVVMDNLSTGYERNILKHIENKTIVFLKQDIRDERSCLEATKNIDFVLHQAALGSVPRSINDPLTTHHVNSDGFLNMLQASKENGIKRFVYASSSSVYGNDEGLPKYEDKVGAPLSPYAVTKKTNELYADVFYKNYNLETIGLRYFNIFGPNQSPQGEYAALIPKFIKSILAHEQPTIFGDGMQARDFTYVENAVQANIRALFASKAAAGEVYNIAVGEKTTVNDLFEFLKEAVNIKLEAKYGSLRPGEIRDSLADITKAERMLGYKPTVTVKEGLARTFEWFLANKEILI